MTYATDENTRDAEVGPHGPPAPEEPRLPREPHDWAFLVGYLEQSIKMALRSLEGGRIEYAKEHLRNGIERAERGGQYAGEATRHGRDGVVG